MERDWYQNEAGNALRSFLMNSLHPASCLSIVIQHTSSSIENIEISVGTDTLSSLKRLLRAKKYVGGLA